MHDEFRASECYASSHQSLSINLQNYDYIQDATSKGFSVTYINKEKQISWDPITGITRKTEGGFALTIETPEALALKQKHEKDIALLELSHNEKSENLRKEFDWKFDQLMQEARLELQRLEKSKQEKLEVLRENHNWQISQENGQYNSEIAVIDRQREEAENKHRNKIAQLNQEKIDWMNNANAEFQLQVQQIAHQHEYQMTALRNQESEVRRQEAEANNSFQQIKAQQARVLQDAQQQYRQKHWFELFFFKQ
ncbi:unnamed protein product [Blepharisma stoltei]|uniref:Uncharacterized protein n=1 Tax=Blepharisma stoltei TaxID=1481888 RepID=A0AAU9IEM6_9CILI|nr:unnamed protein product [Blepharisma stoltei]